MGEGGGGGGGEGEGERDRKKKRKEARPSYRAFFLHLIGEKIFTSTSLRWEWGDDRGTWETGGAVVGGGGGGGGGGGVVWALFLVKHSPF